MMTKFSTLFQDDQSSLSDGSSFDPSTIQTSKSNAWIRRLPVKIMYSNTNQNEFPPLRTRQDKEPNPAGESVKSEFNEETVTKMITSTIKKMEAEQEQKLAEITKTMNERMAKLEKSIGSLVKQVIEATYKLLSTSGTFVTKSDNAILQSEVTMINKKLDGLLAALNGQSGLQAQSPPRKNPRYSGEDQVSSALPIHDEMMGERED